MGFYGKYELLDLVEDGSAKTFLAREIATGRKINVFLFVSEKAQVQAELIRRARAADLIRFPELIEVGDNDGTIYIATQLMGGFTQLKARLFGSPAVRLGGPEKAGTYGTAGVWRVPAASPPEPAKQRDIASQAAPGAGEFTRMFQTPAASIAEPPAGPVAPEPQGPAARAQQPGEFTRLFQAAAPPAPAVKPPGQAPPGEFTRIFGGGASEPQPPPRRSEPGEFTRRFSAPPPSPASGDPPPGAAPPRAFHPPPGEFTRIFGDRGEASAPFSPAAPVEAAPPGPISAAVAEAPASPGEYTRMFSAPASAPPPAPVPPAAPVVAAPPPVAVPGAPVAAPPIPKLTMALLGVIVVLVAVIAVLLVIR
jgi:hypothetical protein